MFLFQAYLPDLVELGEGQTLVTGNKDEGLVSSYSESESRSVVSDSLRPPDYIVHGILQARILEWVAIPFSRVSSQSRD